MKKNWMIISIVVLTAVLMPLHTVSAAGDAGLSTSKASQGTVVSKATLELTAGGATTLEAAPEYDFGQNVIQQKATAYAAVNSGDPLRVKNPGNPYQWAVNLTLGQFHANHSTVVLRGATLQLTPQTTFTGSSVLGTPTYAIKNKGVATSIDNISPAPASQAQTLAAGSGPVTVFQSKSTTSGIGIWEAAYNATLTVPAGNVAGSYTADMTWTLSSTPTDK